MENIKYKKDSKSVINQDNSELCLIKVSIKSFFFFQSFEFTMYHFFDWWSLSTYYYFMNTFSLEKNKKIEGVKQQ